MYRFLHEFCRVCLTLNFEIINKFSGYKYSIILSVFVYRFNSFQIKSRTHVMNFWNGVVPIDPNTTKNKHLYKCWWPPCDTFCKALPACPLLSFLFVNDMYCLTQIKDCLRRLWTIRSGSQVIGIRMSIDTENNLYSGQLQENALIH